MRRQILLLVILLSTFATISTQTTGELRDQSFHQRYRRGRHDHNNLNQNNNHKHQLNQPSSFNNREGKQERNERQSTSTHQQGEDLISTTANTEQSQQIKNQEQNQPLIIATQASNQPQVPQTDGHETQEITEVEEENHEQSHYYHPGEARFYYNILFAAFLTAVGAFCSGMTVGLMSIQTIQLEIMSMSQDLEEKRMAQRILSVTSNHHLFLVTLLLANAMALETLPIIIHNLMPAWAAILFSTVIVLIAAQIIPQAFCTGPKKIVVAYYASPIILAMIKFFWILAYPMAKGLDYLLGEHHHQRIQHKDFANFLTGGSQTLKNTQKLILTSILQLRTKRVPQVMVQLSDLYMLALDEKLTPSKIKQIDQKDFSYILVYKDVRTNVVGVLKTKQFALKYLKSTKKNLIVEDLFVERQDILCVYEDTNLLQMLMLFQARSQRYSIVIGKKKKIEPGIQSIMYSKSDMISSKQQGEILGVVFLYSLFGVITEYDAQVTNALDSLKSNQNKTGNEVEMSQLNRPLLNH